MGPNLCTSWLEVIFNQASPDSPTPELLSHDTVGNSPVQNTKKPTTNIILAMVGLGMIFYNFILK